MINLTTKKRVHSKLTTGEAASYMHDVFLNGIFINFEILQSHGYYEDGTKRPWTYSIFVRDSRNNDVDVDGSLDSLNEALEHIEVLLGLREFKPYTCK